MDINMKNVVLSKKDRWVWINEIVDGQLKPTTKLMYANGESLSDLEEQFANMSNDNLVTAAEDLLARLSFADDVLEAITGIRDAKIYNIM